MSHAHHYNLIMYMFQWKQMFAERFRLRRNWLNGYCNVRTFEGHMQGEFGWMPYNKKLGNGFSLFG